MKNKNTKIELAMELLMTHRFINFRRVTVTEKQAKNLCKQVTNVLGMTGVKYTTNSSGTRVQIDG